MKSYFGFLITIFTILKKQGLLFIAVHCIIFIRSNTLFLKPTVK